MSQGAPDRKIFAAWSITDLQAILGPTRSPPSFSEHLRKRLSILAQQTTLPQARSWLNGEINARLQDKQRSRGPLRPFLTDADVMRVLDQQVSMALPVLPGSCCNTVTPSWIERNAIG